MDDPNWERDRRRLTTVTNILVVVTLVAAFMAGLSLGALLWA